MSFDFEFPTETPLLLSMSMSMSVDDMSMSMSMLTGYSPPSGAPTLAQFLPSNTDSTSNNAALAPSSSANLSDESPPPNTSRPSSDGSNIVSQNESAVPCSPFELTNSASVTTVVSLEVTTATHDELSVSELTNSAINSLSNAFSICLPSNSRRSLRRHDVDNHEPSIVKGVEIDDRTAITGETCFPTIDSASCDVVDLILTVYSDTDKSAQEAGVLVSNQLKANTAELESETILAVRVRETSEVISDNKATNNDRGFGASSPSDTTSSGTTTKKSAIISVVCILVGSVILIAIHKRVSEHRSPSYVSVSAQGSCDESIFTEGSADRANWIANHDGAEP